MQKSLVSWLRIQKQIMPIWYYGGLTIYLELQFIGKFSNGFWCNIFSNFHVNFILLCKTCLWFIEVGVAKITISILSFSFDMRNNTKHWTTSELNEQASFYVNRTGRYTKSGVEIVQSYLQIKGTIYFHKNKLLFRWHIQFHEKSYLYFFLSKVSNGKMLGFIGVEWTFFRLQLVTWKSS